MDDWQAAIANTLNRALNAAVDIRVYKETGVQQGAIWHPNAQQPTQPLPYQQAGASAAGGLPSWLPAALIVGAVALVAWRLAK